jgi:hypothetical protein
MEAMPQAIRYGVRAIIKHPGFTAASVIAPSPGVEAG